MKKEHLSKMKKLMSLEGHMVSFKVLTPGSKTGQKEQTPIILIKEVWKTHDGNLCVKGIDLKKVSSPDYTDDAIRNYRIDRITGNIYDLGLVINSPLVNPPVSKGYTTF